MIKMPERMNKIKKNDMLMELNRDFPSAGCGNRECEKLCAEVLRIAKTLGVSTETMIHNAIMLNISPFTGCFPVVQKLKDNMFFTQPCRFGFIKHKKEILILSDYSEIKIIFHAGNAECDKCKSLDGTAVTLEQWKSESTMKQLGFWKNDDGIYIPHPNCKCRWEQESITLKKEHSIKITSIFDLSNLIKNIKSFRNQSIPKLPKLTNNKADWWKMTQDWFFERGSNPAVFSPDSPESQDIANSFCIKQVKKEYFEKGKFPTGWNFTGPGTATGNYEETECFLGSVSIDNFKIENETATFDVKNTSGWRSGTRLPKSWTNAIKEITGFEITELVTDAPRGKVIQEKIRKHCPTLLKIPGSSYILEKLPSFGGNWEQIYHIRMEWKE